MTLLLLTGKAEGKRSARQSSPRRGADRLLPGLAAAAKKQRAHHGTFMLADRVTGREPNPAGRRGQR
jgi:hypothetical protein